MSSRLSIVGRLAMAVIFLLSNGAFAHNQEQFICEGIFRCSSGWDCIGAMEEHSEKAAYSNAESSCSLGLGAIRVSPFEHEFRQERSGDMFDVARAYFVCRK